MRTNQLTFTRFIAAVFIVFFHFTGNLFPNKSEFIHVIRENFNLGVSYFYVLSGFVMMLAYQRKNRIAAKEYYINRISRLFPLHLFTLLLSIVVTVFVGLNYLRYIKFDLPTLTANFFLYQAWLPSMSLSYNVPSWSISVELFFYFLFPFIFNVIYRKLSLKNFTLFILIFWIACQYFLNTYYFSANYGGVNSLDRYFLMYNPFFHLNSFLIGILGGALFIKYQSSVTKRYDYAILIFLILTTIQIFLLRKFLLHDGLLAVNFALIIFLVAGNTGKITTFFNNKSLVHLGNISFAMYLLQNPVFIFFRKICAVFHFKNEYLIFLCGFIILLICSHFTYKLLEIPVQKKIRHYFKNRPT